MKLLDGEELVEKSNRVKLQESITAELSEEDILRQLKKLKKKKAAGEDSIRNEALIYMEGNTKDRWMTIIKEVWRKKKIPDKWRKAIVTPVFKKGSKTDVKCYRGISLLNTSYKVYASILTEKFTEEVEQKQLLPESQAGFRKARSTAENIYALNFIIEKVISNKGGTLHAFLLTSWLPSIRFVEQRCVRH